MNSSVPAPRMLLPLDEQARAAHRAVRLPTRLKLSYAAGGVLDLTVNSTINVFLLFYATTVCGLPAALAGGALALGLVVDAIVDPLIGSRSDNCHSRWGRRLPFMVIALPLLLGSFVLLFSLPDIRHQWSLFALLALLCITVRVSLSVFTLPYLAVGAELSDDHGERSRIIALRWAAGMIAAFVTVALGFSVFFSGPAGVATRQGYSPFAMTLAGIMLVAALLSMLSVRATLSRQHLPPAAGAASGARLLPELKELLHSRSFIVLFIAALLFSAAQGVTQSLGLHANTFFWRLSTAQIQLAIIAFPVGLILGAPLAGPIIARMESRNVALIGLGSLVLTQALPALLKLCGLLTLQGQALAQLLACFAVTGGIMTTFAGIALLSMMTDAADEHEYLFGARREGLYFASWSFAGKAASGLGTFLSGLALQAIDFPVQQTRESAVPIVLPESMSNALGFLYGPGAALLSILAVSVLLGYRLNRSSHRRMLSELQRRRAH